MANVISLRSKLVYPGVGWIANAYRMLPGGWLGFRPLINTSEPLYAAMRAGFDDSAATLPYASCTAFNAMLAVANALDTLFVKMSPAVYATSKVCEVLSCPVREMCGLAAVGFRRDVRANDQTV